MVRVWSFSGSASAGTNRPRNRDYDRVPDEAPTIGYVRNGQVVGIREAVQYDYPDTFERIVRRSPSKKHHRKEGDRK